MYKSKLIIIKMHKLINYSLSLFLGAHVTTSSTLKIISAASQALCQACSLTL